MAPDRPDLPAAKESIEQGAFTQLDVWLVHCISLAAFPKENTTYPCQNPWTVQVGEYVEGTVNGVRRVYRVTALAPGQVSFTDSCELSGEIPASNPEPGKFTRQPRPYRVKLRLKVDQHATFQVPPQESRVTNTERLKLLMLVEDTVFAELGPFQLKLDEAKWHDTPIIKLYIRAITRPWDVEPALARARSTWRDLVSTYPAADTHSPELMYAYTYLGLDLLKHPDSFVHFPKFRAAITDANWKLALAQMWGMYVVLALGPFKPFRQHGIGIQYQAAESETFMDVLPGLIGYPTPLTQREHSYTSSLDPDNPPSNGLRYTQHLANNLMEDRNVHSPFYAPRFTKEASEKRALKFGTFGPIRLINNDRPSPVATTTYRIIYPTQDQERGVTYRPNQPVHLDYGDKYNAGVGTEDDEDASI